MASETAQLDPLIKNCRTLAWRTPEDDSWYRRHHSQSSTDAEPDVPVVLVVPGKRHITRQP